MAARRVGDTYGGYRARLVEALRDKGISNMAVLAAFGSVPRHLFVPEALRSQAYEDTSLPIGNEQTISQPSTHARYLEALQLTGSERILEIGTGSGYQTALLAQLAEHVMSLERLDALAKRARESINQAGYFNVSIAVADGTRGWLPMAPYDAILVSAAAPDVPAPLVKQLADGGRLVVPLQLDGEQRLVRMVNREGRVHRDELGAARFVPLVGEHGFEGDRTG